MVDGCKRLFARKKVCSKSWVKTSRSSCSSANRSVEIAGSRVRERTSARRIMNISARSHMEEEAAQRVVSGLVISFNNKYLIGDSGTSHPSYRTINNLSNKGRSRKVRTFAGKSR